MLVNITRILLNLEIDIHAAKIGTFGHRAEDVFWLSHQNQALDQQIQERVNAAIMDLLPAN